MSNYVEFEYRITDNGGLSKLGISAEDFDAAVKRVTDDVNGLSGSLVNMSQRAHLLQGITDVVGQLESAFRSLSDTYAVQIQAETRLAQAMRNTMGATDSEIESIKQLAAEQQKLGIVGDEVQLAAAQELATYLEFSDSLKTILPVLNDMVAQQIGLGASAESATQIATMFGKVMNGQTEALSRYGYKFNDAQKEILKFGDESERAAILAEVVSESVGGMNAALAQTSAGKMQQMSNTIGDIKEKLGAVATQAMPVISAMAEIAMASAGIAQLTVALKGLITQQTLAKISALGAAAANKVQALAARMLGASSLTAASGVTALKVATVALYAAMSLGLTLVIQGVIELVSRLASKSRDAAGAIGEIDEAADAYKQTASQMRAELAMQVTELEDLVKHKGKEQAKVEELNRKYGEAFGTYSTAAEWYETLKAKSADYCKQLGYEAQAKVLASRIAEKEMEREEIRRQGREMKNSGRGNTRAFRKLAEQDTELTQSIATDMAAFSSCMDKAAAAGRAVAGAITDTTALIPWQKMSLDDLGKAIQEQEKKVKSLAGTESKAAAASEAAVLKQMKARKAALEKTYGLEGGSSKKNEYDGSRLIANATSLEQAANNVKYYEEAIKKADAADLNQMALLAEKKKYWEDQRDAIQANIDALAVPAVFESLDDYDKAISALQSKRKSASVESLAAIDAEIKRLKEMMAAHEDAAHAAIPVDQIKTYEQLESEIGIYQARLKTATMEERADIQKRIKDLTDLKDKWDDLLATMAAPGDMSTLSTMEDLDNAIAYYSARQKKASAEELAGIQQTIAALEAKRTKLNNIISLPGMQSEVDDLSGLSGNRLRFELELIGLEGVKGKIASLQKMLGDTKSPLDASQREQVESLISSWEEYQLTLQKSNVTVAEGWSNIKGIGDSVENLTETLQGDGDAWEKVSSIIDNTLALYQSLNGVIEIIKTLTTVTNAHTVATEAKGAAETASAAETMGAAATTVAADAAVTASENTKATASVTAAAAQTLSAHASIPFAGIAIGAALVGTLLAVMSSLPKFANGCIAYGPTLGLFGEYAGASNNPEVVAPLDKLRNLIGTPDGLGGGTVEFKIRDRELVGILKKSYNRIDRVK